MGCHIGFYKVLDKPSFDIEKLKEKYLANVKQYEISFKSPWNKLDPNYPFYYCYEDSKEPLTGVKFRHGSAWFDDTELNDKALSTMILCLKNNPLLYQFKNKAFQIPCVQYKGRKAGLVKTFPQFLEFEELACPWVRIWPYDAVFTTKESLLKHLKSKTLPATKLENDRYASWHLSMKDYKEYAEFFNKNFVNGDHLIYLG